MAAWTNGCRPRTAGSSMSGPGILVGMPRSRVPTTRSAGTVATCASSSSAGWPEPGCTRAGLPRPDYEEGVVMSIQPDQARRVGVVGAGVIGGGWALHYLRMGLDVDVYDPAPDARSDMLRMREAIW